MRFCDLPLFASDAELAQAILGKRAPQWRASIQRYEGHGLPPIDPFMGGRYTPAVKQFFDAMNGVNGQTQIPAVDGPEHGQWNDRRKRRTFVKPQEE
ncbi:MAG: hypothetical protein WBG11_15570 [Methylocella sp.]